MAYKTSKYDIRKLTECRRFYKKSDNLKLLEDFENSNIDCMKIDEFSQKDAKCCAASLANSRDLYKKFNILVMVRNDEVFLVKKNVYEDLFVKTKK